MGVTLTRMQLLRTLLQEVGGAVVEASIQGVMAEEALTVQICSEELADNLLNLLHSNPGYNSKFYGISVW